MCLDCGVHATLSRKSEIGAFLKGNLVLPSGLPKSIVLGSKWSSIRCDPRYLGLIQKHGLEISQPGLDAGATWMMTLMRPGQEIHK